MNDRYSSEYPLPGGVEHYFDALLIFLRRAADHPSTAEEFRAWVPQAFPGASGGPAAINGYLSSISRMGLWSVINSVYRLTQRGVELLQLAERDAASARRAILFEKLSHVTGYDVILSQLRDGAATFQQIRERVTTALEAEWNSPNQPMFRVSWLRSLGAVVKSGKAFELTRTGREAVADVGPASLEGNGRAEATESERDVAPGRASSMELRAKELADDLAACATKGGSGVEFEVAAANAFSFLGFEVQRLGGSDNPDLIVSAPMGDAGYRALIETKSRGSGIVQQNDVNFDALSDHKRQHDAEYVSVLAADFTGGNLENWAAQKAVRLIRVEQIQEILTAHAQTVLPLDALRGIFASGGSLDEDTLSTVLTTAEAAQRAAMIAHNVYAAVESQQDKEAAVNANSLFFILEGRYSLEEIEQAVSWLRHDLVAALGVDTENSLHVRIPRRTLRDKLSQLRDTIGFSC